MYFSYVKRFYQNSELFRPPFPPLSTICTKTKWTYVQWTRATRNCMLTPSPAETAQPIAPSNLQNTHGATCASLISRTVTRRTGIKIRPAGNKQFRRFDQEIARGSPLAVLVSSWRGYCRGRVRSIEDAAKGQRAARRKSNDDEKKELPCARSEATIHFIGSRSVEQKIRLSSFHALLIERFLRFAPRFHHFQ